MKIAYFIPGLNAASGVSAFCVEVANCLAESANGVAVVYTDNDSYKPSPKVALVHADMLSALPWRPEVAHIHSLWMGCVVKTMRWCVRNKVLFVVSPHGSLMPRVFQHGRLKKWIFWHFFLKPLVRRAAAIHCTGEAENAAVEKLLGKRCPPIFVAPLGVHLPEFREKPKAEVKTVLFLGRLGEEKGLVKLLDAWNQVKREGWQLVIAGPDWEGYQQVLLDHCRFLNLQYVLSSPQTSNVKHQTSNVKPQTSNIKPQTSNSQPNPIFFTGPVSGDAKDSLYRSADIFVLPSPMENFSHVVIEALAYGVPVIATKGTPWSELESERCGRWIDQGVEPLAAALRELMAMSDEERAAMGANGRRLAASKYQWSKVAATLSNAYEIAIRS